MELKKNVVAAISSALGYYIQAEQEAALLADSSYLKRCSTGIYNGIRSFISYFEGSRGFTVE